MKSMRTQVLVLLAALGYLAIVCLAAEPEVTDAVAKPPGRGNFVMPKLFDFEAFKQKFHRNYPSAVEQLRRAKIFMARAWTVFISAVKYMHRRSTKFLKINPHSDWTKEEREALLNRLPTDPSESTRATSDNSPFPAAEPVEVERLLAEIEAHKTANPDFAAIAAELEQDKKRSRRSVDTQLPEHKLSMEQLAGGSAKFSDDDQPKAISPDEAAQIDSSTSGYLLSVLSSFKSGAQNILSHSSEREGSAEKVEKVEKPSDRSGQKEQTAESELPDGVLIDYRVTGCLPPVKQQRRCAACYAFAATTLFEYLHCEQTGDLVAFSEQYAIDCGERKGLGGCKGGTPHEVSEFYREYGLQPAARYPYEGWKRVCPYSEWTQPERMGKFRVASAKTYALVAPNREKIFDLLKNFGPLAADIKPTDEFWDFGGGVDILRCDYRNQQLGHTMVIVGYGIEDDLDYWIMRNSLGVDYGLEGHYRVHTVMPYGCLFRVVLVEATFETNNKSKA